MFPARKKILLFNLCDLMFFDILNWPNNTFIKLCKLFNHECVKLDFKTNILSYIPIHIHLDYIYTVCTRYYYGTLGKLALIIRLCDSSYLILNLIFFI